MNSDRLDPADVVATVEGTAPAVDAADEDLVMSFPHLLVREAVVFLFATCVLVLLALTVDAPLEGIADSHRTPNPSKAPWYFLGLQELLHYYPPVVAGVMVPVLLIVALAVVPYARINLDQPALWRAHRGRRIVVTWIVIGGLTYAFVAAATTPAWPLAGVTWVIGIAMSLAAALRSSSSPFFRWLHTRSVPFWIFTWGMLCAATLTIIGIAFRGPGWAFTLPWREGVFR